MFTDNFQRIYLSMIESSGLSKEMGETEDHFHARCWIAMLKEIYAKELKENKVHIDSSGAIFFTRCGQDSRGAYTVLGRYTSIKREGLPDQEMFEISMSRCREDMEQSISGSYAERQSITTLTVAYEWNATDQNPILLNITDSTISYPVSEKKRVKTSTEEVYYGEGAYIYAERFIQELIEQDSSYIQPNDEYKI